MLKPPDCVTRDRVSLGIRPSVLIDFGMCSWVVIVGMALGMAGSVLVGQSIH